MVISLRADVLGIPSATLLLSFIKLSKNLTKLQAHYKGAAYYWITVHNLNFMVASVFGQY